MIPTVRWTRASCNKGADELNHLYRADYGGKPEASGLSGNLTLETASYYWRCWGRRQTAYPDANHLYENNESDCRFCVVDDMAAFNWRVLTKR